MTAQQIFDSILLNKCIIIQILDFGNNKLAEIDSTSATHAVQELENVLPNFAGYKKLIIKGKDGKTGTTWSNCCKWNLEFEGAGAQDKIGAPMPSGSIGAIEYVNAISGMMKENFALQKEIMELKIKGDNQDPTKWMPLIREALPILGQMFKINLNSPSIAGTEKDLHLQDNGEKMNEDQINAALPIHLQSIANKIGNAETFLKIILALDNNPLIATRANDIAKVLDAVAKNPGLLDKALIFI